MDRNSIVGLLLIGIILIGYTYLNRPSDEEKEALRKKHDSLVLVEAARRQEVIEAERTRDLELQQKQQEVDSAELKQEYGSFVSAIGGTEEFVSLENNLVKINLSTKGGRIYSVQLKEYKTHDSLPLILWEGSQNKFGINFYAQNRTVNTQELFFVPQDEAKQVVVDKSDGSVSMRLTVGYEKYIEFKYTLQPDSYMMDFNVNVVGMDDLISRSSNYITFNWQADIPSQEKGRKFENQYTALYYKFFEDTVENLSAGGDDEEDLTTKVKWIGFKQQFFSSILIADDHFKGVNLVSKNQEEDSPILKTFNVEISLPYKGRRLESYPMQFYFGPNRYLTLKEYGGDIELHKLIDLGWKMFAWVNRYAVIPLFSFLEKNVTSNYGLIILLLTIIIKLVLAPLTYRSYLSSAKMKVLKPQIDAINEKIPKDKAMERQKATMALYKKVGVSPMGGCLPMLVQFPILIALFRFFPASIELRQKSFLWATDLSSYDSVLDLPFDIPFYGDHVSLFCLLMAVTNVIYTRMNQQMTSSSQQMPGMQTMMYLMPIMFLVWFNNYASGLSYYYFIATLFTVGQTVLIRKFFVDDKKILEKLEAAKKRPVKKSKFQQRMEDMTKQKGHKK